MISFDELEFDDVAIDYIDVRYRGKLFTGTAVKETIEGRLNRSIDFWQEPREQLQPGAY